MLFRGQAAQRTAYLCRSEGQPIGGQHIYAASAPSQKADKICMLTCSFVGSPDTVQRKLDAFVTATGVNELMVASAIFDHRARLRSYELLSKLGDQFLIDKAA